MAYHVHLVLVCKDQFLQVEMDEILIGYNMQSYRGLFGTLTHKKHKKKASDQCFLKLIA